MARLKKKPQTNHDTIILPVHQGDTAPSIHASLIWKLMDSTGQSKIAQCFLEVNAPTGYAVNVKKLNGMKGHSKSLLCRCTAKKGGGYAGSFVLCSGDSAVISVDKKAAYDIEIPMGVAQVVYRGKSEFEDAYVKCIDQWEMTLEVKGENSDGSNETDLQNA